MFFDRTSRSLALILCSLLMMLAGCEGRERPIAQTTVEDARDTSLPSTLDLPPVPPPEEEKKSPEATPAALRPEPPGSDKALPPVKLQLDLETPEHSGEEWHAGIQLTYQVLADAEKIQVSFEVEGPARIKVDKSLEMPGLKSGESANLHVEAVLPAGRSEIRAQVQGWDSAGALVFGRSIPLYVIARPEKVLSGKDGFLAVELTELKRQFEAGEIDEASYRARSQDLRMSGALVEVQITPPPTAP